ncbi:uncharacterized protein F5147DRAFT_657420 [Suillus discolor]|uniref:Uncharacterized protein n=1 Tax=Suillus discolor TaxID=1912936 RepID=A0A9P7EWV1_9AGAM|nr:uncharacterized protein F5147DRAFT_657420 [Suillus discolor]KAG2093525.1 hypothetical protein F5147DRAFT_657420 [Suillus discolor]
MPNLATAVEAYLESALVLLDTTDEVILQRLNSSNLAKEINNSPLQCHQKATTMKSYEHVTIGLLAMLLRTNRGDKYEIPISLSLAEDLAELELALIQGSDTTSEDTLHSHIGMDDKIDQDSKQHDSLSNKAFHDTPHSGDKIIPHSIDGVMADIMIQDLTLTRPFTKVATHICYPDKPSIKELYQTQIFMNNHKLFTTDQLSATMARESIDKLSFHLGINSWCYISTAFKCKLGRFAEELLEEDDEDTVEALQAGHSRMMENRIYSLSPDTLAGGGEDLLPQFLQANTNWQLLICKLEERLIAGMEERLETKMVDMITPVLEGIVKEAVRMATLQ